MKRDTLDIANDPLSSLLRPLSVSRVLDPPVEPLLEVDDRRSWHPERSDRPVMSVSGPVGVQVVRPARGLSVPPVPAQVSFRSPNRVVTCVRRERRREVMFALGRTGKGSRSRRHRRSWRSDFSCKR